MSAEPAPAQPSSCRKMRIKQGQDFMRIRREGRRSVLGCMIANWRVLPPGSDDTRLGVITAAKIGNAVIQGTRPEGFARIVSPASA